MDTLHNVMTFQVDQRVRRIATTMQDIPVLAKLAGDDIFLIFLFMHFCPGTITTQVKSINSDLQLGLDRHLRHTQH